MSIDGKLPQHINTNGMSVTENYFYDEVLWLELL